MNATNPNAVAVWTPEEATRSLTRSVRSKATQREIAHLLGVDPDSSDPKEAAKAKAMLDRFVAVALHAATSDSKILRADRMSIIQSIRDSALLGLEPVGVTGDGAIVVYEETRKEEVPSPSGRPGATVIIEKKVPIAHFQPMYRGLLKLARRSDQIAHVDAHVVYKGDTIELDLGSQPSVKHYPALEGADRGDVVGAYAVAELTNGRRYVEWMTKADIEEVRKSSRGNAKPDSPWVRFWPEMARKTVLRRMMKRLPLETMAEHGLRLENEAESRGMLLSAGDVEEAPKELESGARRRLRSRFVDEEANGSPPDEDGPPPPAEPPAATPASDQGESPLSVDPRPSEPPKAVSGEVIEPESVDQAAAGGICGATSDPALGDPETCVREPGHTNPDGTKSPHVSKEGTRWPNR